jgi:hypothetical protein
MPGLLRGVARTAVIAGTATSVSNRVSRRQAQRWSQQDQYGYDEPAYQEPPPPAPVAPAAPAADPIQQLKDLAALKEQGVLTEDEFAVQKAKILNS